MPLPRRKCKSPYRPSLKRRESQESESLKKNSSSRRTLPLRPLKTSQVGKRKKPVGTKTSSMRGSLRSSRNVGATRRSSGRPPDKSKSITSKTVSKSKVSNPKKLKKVAKEESSEEEDEDEDGEEEEEEEEAKPKKEFFSNLPVNSKRRKKQEAEDKLYAQRLQAEMKAAAKGSQSSGKEKKGSEKDKVAQNEENKDQEEQEAKEGEEQEMEHSEKEDDEKGKTDKEEAVQKEATDPIGEAAASRKEESGQVQEPNGLKATGDITQPKAAEGSKGDGSQHAAASVQSSSTTSAPPQGQPIAVPPAKPKRKRKPKANKIYQNTFYFSHASGVFHAPSSKDHWVTGGSQSYPKHLNEAISNGSNPRFTVIEDSSCPQTSGAWDGSLALTGDKHAITYAPISWGSKAAKQLAAELEQGGRHLLLDQHAWSFQPTSASSCPSTARQVEATIAARGVAYMQPSQPEALESQSSAVRPMASGYGNLAGSGGGQQGYSLTSNSLHQTMPMFQYDAASSQPLQMHFSSIPQQLPAACPSQQFQHSLQQEMQKQLQQNQMQEMQKKLDLQQQQQQLAMAAQKALQLNAQPISLLGTAAVTNFFANQTSAGHQQQQHQLQQQQLMEQYLLACQNRQNFPAMAANGLGTVSSSYLGSGGLVSSGWTAGGDALGKVLADKSMEGQRSSANTTFIPEGNNFHAPHLGLGQTSSTSSSLLSMSSGLAKVLQPKASKPRKKQNNPTSSQAASSQNLSSEMHSWASALGAQQGQFNVVQGKVLSSSNQPQAVYAEMWKAHHPFPSGPVAMATQATFMGLTRVPTTSTSMASGASAVPAAAVPLEVLNDTESDTESD